MNVGWKIFIAVWLVILVAGLVLVLSTNDMTNVVAPVGPISQVLQVHSASTLLTS